MFNKHIIDYLFTELKPDERLVFYLDDSDRPQFRDEEFVDDKGIITNTVFHMYDTNYSDEILRILRNEKKNFLSGEVSTYFVPYEKIKMIKIERFSRTVID